VILSGCAAAAAAGESSDSESDSPPVSDAGSEHHQLSQESYVMH
jgi:hypothetical protein